MSCRRTLPFRVAFTLAAAVHAGVLSGCEREPERPQTPEPELVRRFPLPAAGAQPLGIAAGPDGAMWFTERNANRIGRIGVAPPHAISEYPLPTPGSGPYAIAAGPDGKLWFTEFPGDRIGRIDPRSPGAIFELMIPTSEARARAITTGPDGNVWFAEQPWRIGRVVLKPTPTIDDFALPRYGTYANGIVAGADGHLWYAADKGVVGRVLAVWPESILELQLRTKKGDSSVIAAGSDGNIWVVQGQTGTIARMRLAPPHAVTELRLPGAAAEPKDLYASPGHLWLSLAGRTSIVRIEVTPPHRIREIPIPEALGPPESIAMGPDGNIWFTAPAGNSIGRLDVRALESRGAEQEGATSAPAVQVAEYEAGPAPVPQGELVIQTDANCTVSIDGVEMFRLARGQGRVVDLRVGTHLVTAVSATGPERWERSVDVFSGLRASADIELLAESRGVRPESSRKFVPGNPRIEFVSIPAGEFVMGSNTGFADERPPHRVRLTASFQMGKYEVTQEEWAAVMGPIEFDESQPQWVSARPRMRYLDQHTKSPVVGVSWDDAQEFLAKLDTLDNRHLHRLPTEAEWEYACRAGTTFDLPPNIDEMAWLQGMELRVQKVGQKKPNAWGFHDMHGNADEWVADWYDKDYYRRTPPVDPPGPTSGQTRVIRGGDMWNPASDARCANRRRGGSPPASRSGMVGFRVVRRAR